MTHKCMEFDCYTSAPPTLCGKIDDGLLWVVTLHYRSDGEWMSARVDGRVFYGNYRRYNGGIVTFSGRIFRSKCDNVFREIW